MKKFLSVLIIVLSVITCASCQSGSKSSDDSGKIMRLHILADNDSRYSQDMKLKVRDAIVNAFTPELSKMGTIDEARTYVLGSLDKMKQIAQDELKKNNCDYPVNIQLKTEYFPDRIYNGTVYPAGEYEAVKILLGKGEGQNWWCVVFPPLCFGGEYISSDEDVCVKSFIGELLGF